MKVYQNQCKLNRLTILLRVLALIGLIRWCLSRQWKRLAHPRSDGTCIWIWILHHHQHCAFFHIHSHNAAICCYFQPHKKPSS